MKKKYNALCVIVLFISNIIYGMNENNNNIFRKNFLEYKWTFANLINKTLVAPWYDKHFPEDENSSQFPDAGKKYQKLGQEAQDSLGIPRKYHLPVKRKIPKRIGFSGGTEDTDFAETTPEAIVIKESILEKKDIGVQKFVLLHEAAHVANQDWTKTYLKTRQCQIFTLLSSPMIFLYLQRNPTQITRSLHTVFPSKWQKAIFSFLTSLGLSSSYQGFYNRFMLSKYCKFQEKRADTDAYKAIGCYQCLKNVAQLRAYQNTEEGYLTKEELLEKSEEIRKEKKLCNKHNT